jgi:hypothetical protein
MTGWSYAFSDPRGEGNGLFDKWLNVRSLQGAQQFLKNWQMTNLMHKCGVLKWSYESIGFLIKAIPYGTCNSSMDMIN